MHVKLNHLLPAFNKMPKKLLAPREASRSEAALHILLTAERLFSEKGLDAVSTRSIAREAGQKNVSALHYYFGDKKKLIEAILDYRITPVNAERLTRLKRLKRSGDVISIKALVELFVEPFALELLKPLEHTCYIPLLAQLYASRWGRELYVGNRKRARELNEITSLLIKKLVPRTVADVHLKLQFMGRQTISTVAEWHEENSDRTEPLDEKTLRWRCSVLIDFLVGGLQGGGPLTRSVRTKEHSV